MRIVVWSVVALMLMSFIALAQFVRQESFGLTQRDSIPTLTPISPEDSARYVNSVSDIKGKRVDTVSTAYKPTKSPGLALLFSAVLPGAGQFYNESYWKIPILVGFGYYFATRWLDNNDSTKRYRDLYAQSITKENSAGNGNYQRLREFYKDQRDAFSWYIFIYYIVNLVDAYVDASLYDFNVGDDLSIRVRPEFDFQRSNVPKLSIKVRF
jgi:hypothetical protein